MTIGTEARRDRVQAGQLEASRGVVKRGIGPQIGVVTGFAGCRERGRYVVHRRGRIVVVVLMT